MMNKYIKFIMNRVHEAKSKLNTILTYPGAIIIN